MHVPLPVPCAGDVANNVGRSTGRDFEASDLGRLPLLSAVIKEGLRLCAPAPFGGTRHVVDEHGAQLCGFHVPKVRLLAAMIAWFGMMPSL